MTALPAESIRDFADTACKIGREVGRTEQSIVATPSQASCRSHFVVTLSRQSSWTHFLALIPMREPTSAVAMAPSLVRMSPRIEHKRCSSSLLYPVYHMERFGPLA